MKLYTLFGLAIDECVKTTRINCAEKESMMKLHTPFGLSIDKCVKNNPNKLY